MLCCSLNLLCLDLLVDFFRLLQLDAPAQGWRSRLEPRLPRLCCIYPCVWIPMLKDRDPVSVVFCEQLMVAGKGPDEEDCGSSFRGKGIELTVLMFGGYLTFNILAVSMTDSWLSYPNG